MQGHNTIMSSLTGKSDTVTTMQKHVIGTSRVRSGTDSMYLYPMCFYSQRILNRGCLTFTNKAFSDCSITITEVKDLNTSSNTSPKSLRKSVKTAAVAE